MNKQVILKKLVERPALSGYEKVLGFSGLVASFFQSENMRVTINDVGSVVAARSDINQADILITAHIDEVGLMVSKVLPEKVKFVPVGGVSPKSALNSRVELYSISSDRTYSARVRSKTKTPRTMNSLWIETPGGYEPQVLDPVWFQRTFDLDEKNGVVKAPGLDNKVGVCALILLAKELKPVGKKIIFVGTAQEETTSGGILQIIQKYKPGLIIDMDAAYGSRKADNSNISIPIIGRGAGLQVVGKGLCFEKSFFLKVCQCLKGRRIPFQFELPDPQTGGTCLSSVTNYIQRYLQVNIPVTNQHQALGCANVKDIASAIRIVKEIVSINF